VTIGGAKNSQEGDRMIPETGKIAIPAVRKRAV
jgi:hypothetical protein